MKCKETLNDSVPEFSAARKARSAMFALLTGISERARGSRSSALPEKEKRPEQTVSLHFIAEVNNCNIGLDRSPAMVVTQRQESEERRCRGGRAGWHGDRGVAGILLIFSWLHGPRRRPAARRARPRIGFSFFVCHHRVVFSDRLPRRIRQQNGPDLRNIGQRGLKKHHSVSNNNDSSNSNVSPAIVA